MESKWRNGIRIALFIIVVYFLFHILDFVDTLKWECSFEYIEQFSGTRMLKMIMHVIAFAKV